MLSTRYSPHVTSFKMHDTSATEVSTQRIRSVDGLLIKKPLCGNDVLSAKAEFIAPVSPSLILADMAPQVANQVAVGSWGLVLFGCVCGFLGVWVVFFFPVGAWWFFYCNLECNSVY